MTGAPEPTLPGAGPGACEGGRRSRRVILALTALSALLGGVVGAVADHRYFCSDCNGSATVAAAKRCGEHWVDDQVDHLARELDLSATQRADLRATFAAMQPRYAEIYAAVGARRASVDRELAANLRRLLCPTQCGKLEKLIAQDEARRRAYYGLPLDGVAEEVAAPAPPAPPRKPCSNEPRLEPASYDAPQ